MRGGTVERLERAVVAVGGILSSVAVLAHSVPNDSYIVPYLIAEYAMIVGVLMPAVLYAILVGPLSWSAMKQRWRAMRRPSFRW
ncbi:MAG TPA: hypothetical protein VEM77_01200 [Thermoplasmata archaeon]|nr:hypothetical protein [Thermoplasmata archaeon]